MHDIQKAIWDLDRLSKAQQKVHHLRAGDEASLAMFLSLWLDEVFDWSEPIFFIGHDYIKISELYHALTGLMSRHADRVKLLPEGSLWGKDRYELYSSRKKARLEALSACSLQKPCVVLATTPGIHQTTMTFESWASASLLLCEGGVIGLEEVGTYLEDHGFSHSPQVGHTGQFAIRGGLLDVFPGFGREAFRLEWWGETIESIRVMDVETQLSGETVKELWLTPLGEFDLGPKNRKSSVQRVYEKLMEQNAPRHEREPILEALREGLIFSGIDVFAPWIRSESKTVYEQAKGRFVLLDPLEDLEKNFSHHLDSCHQKIQEDRSQNKYSPGVFETFVPLGPSWPPSGRLQFDLRDPIDLSVTDAFRGMPDLGVKAKKAHELLELYLEKLRESVHNSGCGVILYRNPKERETLEKILASREIPFALKEGLGELFLSSKPVFPSIYLVKGDGLFRWLLGKEVVVLPAAVVFGRKIGRGDRSKKRLQHLIKKASQLSEGDFIVHGDHGIGVYRGLRVLETGAVKVECVELEFQGGDKIFLPVDRLQSIGRYVGEDAGVKPQLDRLGGVKWQKSRKKASRAAEDVADKLLAMKAMRQQALGIQIPEASELYYEFEAGFPYEETPDQLRAIEETHADLMSNKPMDRLICGDVGFGKTEVALRAAMRVVLAGYQVMLVAPTTVLSFQHFRNFKQRCEPFGARVGVVNRFVSGKELKETLQLFKFGQVDILIGSHRALSKDVKGARLGLVIIDEEQKFGVSQKEMIRSLAEGCELLTMTATPIPRTLHMSILGLRDISLISTPPKARKPIKTYVAPFDDHLVTEALRAELARKGQVFFLHNEVKTIHSMAQRLSHLCPEGSVKVAHGQMPSHTLEKVMMEFLEGKFQILCCTTIIEAGIDMPHVNTLMVSQSDRFGLAQLYQIRGRVGRSDRQAYCYLLYDPLRPLSPQSRNRLEVLCAHQELGSGFAIANHDLEMRGAGELLGAGQSGHVASVGYELYTQMLDQAIRKKQGFEDELEHLDPEIRLAIEAYIPSSYIESEGLRLAQYRALFSAQDEESLAACAHTLKDRFGAIPKPTEMLLLVAKLKLRLKDIGGVLLKPGPADLLEVTLVPQSPLRKPGGKDKVAALSKEFLLPTDSRLLINLKTEQDKFTKSFQDLQKLYDKINQLALILEES